MSILQENWIDIHNQDKEYTPKVVTSEMIQKAEAIYTMWCMDSDIVGNRVADKDFMLDDPAKDETDTDVVFKSCKEQIEALVESCKTYKK